MTVRVVAKVVCDGPCNGDGSKWVPHFTASGREVGERLTNCPVCHGKGTVEREVYCNTCKYFEQWWPERIPDGECCRKLYGDSPLYPRTHRESIAVRPDFACKAWERTE